MGTPVVRAFEDVDLSGAVRALVDVYATDGYPVEGVMKPDIWIKPAGVIQAWVAELEDHIVGHIAVMKPQGGDAVRLWREQSGDEEAGIGVLARLFVVRHARRMSIGEELLCAAMDFARSSGRRLVLDVMVKDASAIRLYERLGWERIGEATHHYGNGQSITAICYVSPST